MKRHLKNLIKRKSFSLYRFGTKLGVHILPVHYYSPVPNVVELEKTRATWAKKSELPGITVDLDEQVNNLKTTCMPYRSEYEGNKTYRYAVHASFGPGYGYIEAQTLHAVIRYYQPKRIIEVGSGVSTWCMLAAARMNKEESGNDCSITCIDPYASEKLKSIREIEVIEKQVQLLSYKDVFVKLARNDLLFVDTSHTVKPGSDVNHLILEILPRLKAGVIVHFHDIYLPYDYGPHVLQTFFHWAETSLLRAFLIHNHKVRIVFCLSHLHYDRRDAMKDVFPEYNPQLDIDGIRHMKYLAFEHPIDEHFPASTYIQIQ